MQQALKLITYLRGMPGSEQVAGVDVADFSTTRTLALVTEAGNRIIWGAPPDEFGPGQSAARVRAQRLEQLLRVYGRIDAGRPLIDLRPESAPYLIDVEAATMASAVGTTTTARAPAKPPRRAGR